MKLAQVNLAKFRDLKKYALDSPTLDLVVNALAEVTSSTSTIFCPEMTTREVPPVTKEDDVELEIVFYPSNYDDLERVTDAAYVKTETVKERGHSPISTAQIIGPVSSTKERIKFLAVPPYSFLFLYIVCLWIVNLVVAEYYLFIRDMDMESFSWTEAHSHLSPEENHAFKRPRRENDHRITRILHPSKHGTSMSKNYVKVNKQDFLQVFLGSGIGKIIENCENSNGSINNNFNFSIVAGTAGTASTVVVIVGTIHASIKKTANQMLLLDYATKRRSAQREQREASSK